MYDIYIFTRHRFFHSTGAVAGVFFIVGLAVATICLWTFFFIRRKHCRRRIEYASEVSATPAAAGYNRVTIDNEDLGPVPGMRQWFGSLTHTQRSAYPLPTKSVWWTLLHTPVLARVLPHSSRPWRAYPICPISSLFRDLVRDYCLANHRI